MQDTARTIRFTRGSNYTPSIIDIDGDGDLDVFVGEASGEFNFVRNTGSTTAPQFTVESEAFQELDAGRRSHPAFVDLDGDGDYDLLSGNENGGSIYFRNEGTPQAPRFVADPSLQLRLLPLSAPVFVDLDGDGVQELITGSLSGGLTYWRRPNSPR